MLKKSFLLSIYLFLNINFGLTQEYTQNIRGNVTEVSSNMPIAYANVYIKVLVKGTTTDSLGNFVLRDIPIGRYEIEVSLIGYETSIQKEVVVISSKETILNIFIKEKITQLSEVVVNPKTNKEKPLNSIATISAKLLSVEEASRYAGGFDDPARLVSAFAGVNSNINKNGIIVRGNNPKSLQWKMEGVEISNPNHFADLLAFGAGGLSALSSQCLANSDFFTGAFPSEYSNALSGVFDIAMRNGNSNKNEHTFQLGLTGTDIASEGPFKKGSSSSYLFNYRYSTLSLLAPILPFDVGGVNYQDLSYKLNFPTKKIGTFSFWGIGLLDRDNSGQDAVTDSASWEAFSDKQSQSVKQYMGAIGINHKFFINTKSYWKTTLATTFNGLDLTTSTLDNNLQFQPDNMISSSTINYVLTSFLNTRINTRLTNRTGIIVTNMNYKQLFKKSISIYQPLTTVVDENGSSFLLTSFVNFTYNFSEKITLNAGANVQQFTLNKRHTIEPRIGFKYQFKPLQSLSLAYGLHSRMERINFYFAKNSSNITELLNKNIDFTKAHHFVFGYDINLTENLHLKVEAYYQYLFDVPVIKDSSFSYINMENDWFFNEKLENSGKGRNIGLDISLDKYMSNGLYYMLTGSVFKSEYTGGDNIWRSTRFNRNFALNILIGKEWYFGNSKQKTFGLNGRLSYQGGDRYSPINQTASIQKQDVVFDEYNAFSKQFKPSLVSHLTILYKTNRKKSTHEIALKIINATMYKEFFYFRYNYKTQQVEEYRKNFFIPNLSYKIDF